MQQKVAPLRSNLEQRLTQAILMSQNPQSALLEIAQLIAAAFQVQGCVILSPGRVVQINSWFKAELDTNRAIQNLLARLVTTSPPDWSARGDWVTNCSTEASAEESIVLWVYWVPTQFQGQVNGAIGLVRSQFQEWDKSAVHLLESLSPQVAIAIAQAQLGQQLQQQIRYQTLIDQLTTAIRNAWDLEEIFNLAVEGTATALEVDRGLLLLFKYADPLRKSRNLEGIPKTQATVAAEWLSESSASTLAANQVFSASECCICQQVLRTTEPIVVPVGEILNDPSRSAASQGVVSLCKLAPSHALLLMPLENQGTVLGCLVLHQHQPRLWSTEELSFVKLAVAQLSTAIIQSRTLKQIQGVVQERTVQLQRSLEVQAKLYEKTRQQVEQLRKLNAEREEFLSTVSHELRTPLTSMMLAIRMLRQADLAPDRQQKYLDILEQQCIQETNLINDMLALRKLDNPVANQLQKIDLRYLLEGVAQSVKASWAEKGLMLTLAPLNHPVTLFTDPDSLNRILLELLANARKYAKPESTVELEVMANPPRGQVVISVRNIGDGILPEELPHIFEKFRRGQGVTKRAIQGTGLGLALVKGLVEHLNGTIAATSQPCPVPDSDCWETCFTLALPQRPEGAIALASS